MIETDLPQFDVRRLLLDITKVRYLYNGHHVNLRVPNALSDHTGVYYGAESLYRKNVQVIQQSEYDRFLSVLDDSYLKSVCEQTIDYISSSYNLSVGRVRVAILPHKYCLTYHRDPESAYRFHIPVVTNENVMFIIDDTVRRMDICGQLYMLDVQKKHTVLNASREERIHIIFDGYVPTT